MKARIVIVLVAALALPAGALAKGPTEASISGPGLDRPLRIDGFAESGALVQSTGFFPAVFGQSPDPMLRERPNGDLGPRYTIAFKVPTGVSTAQTIRMDVYPHAEGGAVTYTKPGQRIFSTTTDGGWFQGGSELKRVLVQAGLPSTAPSGGSGFTLPFDSAWSLVTGIALALLAGLGFAAVAYRRQAAAPAR